MSQGWLAKNRRVLVTGATGFIGRHCLPRLCRRGVEIHGVTTRPFDRQEGPVQWHRADLLNRADARRLISLTRPTHLLHLAWVTSPGSYRASPENARWVDASLELFRRFADAGGRRVVIAGTCLEYGPSQGPCHEIQTLKAPSTAYGQAKLAMWRGLEELAGERGLSASTARIFHLYGPHEHRDRFVPAVILPLVDGREARCSSGEQVRDFLHVRDVAAACIELLLSDVQGPVNIASGASVAVRDVALEIGRLMGCEELVQLGSLPKSPGDPHCLTADVTSLAQDVGWRPRHDLQSGLQNTIDWWRKCKTPVNPRLPLAPLAAVAQSLSS